MPDIKKHKRIIVTVCRIILGAVFVFSGVMKGIDTWGTAQKVGEYFTAFGMEWLHGTKVVVAVLLSALELTLGLMLLFNVRIRLTSLVSLVFMSGFTVLTLVIAIWNPLDDCGCFGEALAIDNWMSFVKNVVLLALALTVWYFSRNGRFFAFLQREGWLTAVFFLFAVALGAGSYRHLPLIDMFPFKKGVDLRTDVLCTACIGNSTVLVYKDLQTGNEVEFSLSDTEWYDSDRWEYVRTESAYDDITFEDIEKDFAIFSGDYNIADEIVFHEGLSLLICIRDLNEVSGKCMDNLSAYVGSAVNTNLYVITEKREGEQTPEDYPYIFH